MVFAYLNVSIGISACIAYSMAWFLDVPISVLVTPFSRYFIILPSCAIFVSALLCTRIKKLSAPFIRDGKAGMVKFAHAVLVAANVALVGGAIATVLAGRNSKEDEYWAGNVVTFFVGPVAVALAALGFVMILAALCNWRAEPKSETTG